MKMVLIVGDNVGYSFQSSGLPNKETCTKISRKSEMSRMWTHFLSLGPFKQHHGKYRFK